MRMDARTHCARRDAFVPSSRPGAAAVCVYIGDSRNPSIRREFMPKRQPTGSKLALVLFVSLVMWLDGGMLYIWIISLIFYRFTFFPLEPSDLTPTYWINMGSVAISTLAGTVLIVNA